MLKFPSMRTGKYIAQGAHASQLALREAQDWFPDWYKEYMEGHIRKIVVYVNTTEELEELYWIALGKQLPTALVKDSGFTEFKGVPTLTAVGIGPAPDDLIDPITKHLPLF